MKHIVAVSVAIVAIGSLSGSSRPGPRSRSETRRFIYASPPGGAGGETVTREGDVISGDMWIGAKHAHYAGRIAADGTIPRLDIRAWRSAAEAKHPRMISAIVGRDSTQLIEHLGRRVDTLRFASQPGLLPVINPSMGLLELVIAQVRAKKTRSAKVPILAIDALDLDSPRSDKVDAAPMPVDVTFLAADSIRLGNPTSADQMRFVIDADGHIRSARNGSTTKDRFSMQSTSKPVSPRK